MTDAPVFISVERASRVLDVSRDTGYRWAREGVFPVLRIGRRFRVPVRAFAEFAGLTEEETLRRSAL